MKTFFGMKSVKIIISILLVIISVVCICNGYFGCDEISKGYGYM